jgi:hypothetical protein
MDDSAKIKILSKMLSKRYPFIKELRIEDDSYTVTLFLEAEIDAIEMCETFGFTPHIRNIGYLDYSGTLMGFVVEEDRDRAYEVTKKINGELWEINKLIPEQFQINKSPNINKFFVINSSTF